MCPALWFLHTLSGFSTGSLLKAPSGGRCGQFTQQGSRCPFLVSKARSLPGDAGPGEGNQVVPARDLQNSTKGHQYLATNVTGTTGRTSRVSVPWSHKNLFLLEICKTVCDLKKPTAEEVPIQRAAHCKGTEVRATQVAPRGLPGGKGSFLSAAWSSVPGGGEDISSTRSGSVCVCVGGGVCKRN